MSISFQIIDVFTHRRFLGNPLAIVILHHADLDSIPTQSLTQQQKQLLAREFNLSETVFIHTTQRNHNDPSEPFVIDIFTTTEELPFAGHPTIGAGWFLAQRWKTRTEFRLSTRAGEILVTNTSRVNGSVGSANMDGVNEDVPAKLVKLQVPIDFMTHPLYHSPGLSTLKSKVHQPELEPDDYVNGVEGAEPVASIVKGMSFILIQLSNEGALARMKPLYGITEAELRVPDNHLGDWKGFSSLYVFVIGSNDTHLGSADTNDSIFDEVTDTNANDIIRIRTRVLHSGGLEDPATGSAASTLCGWLAVQKGAGKWRFEVIQGIEIGRESRIGVLVDVDGHGSVSKIELLGGAVKVAEGVLQV
ncbi:hypothetical protein F5878DRAFT_632095 [Lentinula raphanica]|uniref:Diaminopimelate epimerase-like protein n=1 Tax=Lentinula raphanica TaxID=153919 RepID=A0AA38U7G5_9AGAR|nr:hypothetical protein F5878DRAFT_632095 [Lentinula raphanica]